MRNLGRYQIYDELASGGMGTIHLGRISGAAGFARIVAVKRLHEHRAKDPKFLSMLVDEARLAARIRHSNVAATLDVVALSGELFVVMEYIHGASLSHLMQQASLEGVGFPQPIASAIVRDLLRGLHAAHTAKSETGTMLGLVHRDVSPQNVLVGVDGIARVVDFGVAKAAQRLQSTGEGELKGKLGYMAPEQAREEQVDSRADLFAAGIVLWELLSGRRLFTAKQTALRLSQLLAFESRTLDATASQIGLTQALMEVVHRALATEPEARFSSGEEFAQALTGACSPAPSEVVGDFVRTTAATLLADRDEVVARIERAPAAPVTPGQRGMEEEPTHLLDPQLTPPGGQSERPKRRAVGWAVLGLLVGLSLAGWTLWRVLAEAPPKQATLPSQPATLPSREAVPHPPTSTPDKSRPAVEPAHIPPEPVEASPPSAAPAQPKVAAPPRQPAFAPRTPRTPRPASDPCVPPYVFIDGKKKYKTECL